MEQSEAGKQSAFPPFIGLRDLARNTAGVLDEVNKSRKPKIVMRHGKPLAILLPFSDDQLRELIEENLDVLLGTQQD